MHFTDIGRRTFATTLMACVAAALLTVGLPAQAGHAADTGMNPLSEFTAETDGIGQAQQITLTGPLGSDETGVMLYDPAPDGTAHFYVGWYHNAPVHPGPLYRAMTPRQEQDLLGALTQEAVKGLPPTLDPSLFSTFYVHLLLAVVTQS